MRYQFGMGNPCRVFDTFTPYRDEASPTHDCAPRDRGRLAQPARAQQSYLLSPDASDERRQLGRDLQATVNHLLDSACIRVHVVVDRNHRTTLPGLAR